MRAHFWLAGVSTLSLFLILAFQNCSPKKVTFSSEFDAHKTAVEGGGTYDGKPISGNYVRIAPEGCESPAGEKIVGLMSIGFVHGKITEDICTPMDYSFSFSDPRLEYSFYNPDLVGFNSAIFELAQKNNTDQPNKAGVQLWCRHLESQSGLDLVVRGSGAASKARLYLGENLHSNTPSSKQMDLLNVLVAATDDHLRVTSTDGLDVQVNLTDKTSDKLPAYGQIPTDDGVKQLALDCRVAGRRPAVYEKPQSLLAMYQLNGILNTSPVGSQIRDSSWQALDGQLLNPDGLGARYVSGVRDTALAFDGIDDTINISNLAPLVQNRATVSMWLRPDASIADDRLAFSITTAGMNRIRFGTGLCNGTQDRTHLALDVESSCYDTGIVITDGNWHMVSVVIDNDTVVLYLAGKEIARKPLFSPLTTNDRWCIGCDIDGDRPDDFWQGLIDEVIVWNSPLNPTELLQVYR